MSQIAYSPTNLEHDVTCGKANAGAKVNGE